MLTAAIREIADRRELAIPETTQIVKAAFLDNKRPEWGRRAGGRELLAGWVTAADNPYFARAAVNRVWARFFGTGIVDPVDDFRDDNPPSHPELLDLLAREFRSHGYDLKFLIRAITATRAYGLTSAVGRSELAPANLFAAMPVRTLSPGQLFEALAQATGFRDDPSAGFFYEGSAKDRFVELFTNRDEKPTEGETTILQALALMNGPLVASVDQPGDQRYAGRPRRGSVSRHPGTDRDPVPGCAHAPAACRRAGEARALRRARRPLGRPRQGARRRFLGLAQQPRVSL